MKVVLLDNIRKVGHKGDIIEVSDGYARNHLIKNGLAKAAVGGNLKIIENKKSKEKEKEKEKNKLYESLYKKINKKSFILKQKTSEKGHLFAAIHKKDIAKLIEVEEKNVLLELDIKEIGDYPIKIKLGNLTAKINLSVEKLD